MPSGLLNSFTPEEVVALAAFLLQPQAGLR